MERKRDEERRKKVKDYLRSVRLFTNQNSIWQIQNVGNAMCVCVCLRAQEIPIEHWLAEE